MTGVTVLKLVDPIYTILMEFESLRELLETLYLSLIHISEPTRRS